MDISYKPFLERTPDSQYQDALRAVFERGVRASSAHETGSVTLMGQVNFCYHMSNGYPLIPDRNMDPPPSEKMPIPQWQQAKAEILAFINGAHTQEELEKFGCLSFWRDTVTGEEGERKCKKRGLEVGDLGPASYGAVFGKFPLIEPKLLQKIRHTLSPDALTEFDAALRALKVADGFNQVKAVLNQIKNEPKLRTHWIEPWYSPGIWREDQSVVVCPCHGWIHIRILDDGQLYYHMHQRSGDMVLGVPNNIVEHAGLALAFARATGYPLAQYSHSISDAHLYLNHMEAVETLLSRPPRRLPTMKLREGVDDLFAIRREDFILSDYFPHPGIGGIPLSV
ncbi:MAG TPA: thymidylate synthase [Verrucomicrobiae bacterium]|nr:thymidylate synthase [Verrucomicrobiae bacterium]